MAGWEGLLFWFGFSKGKEAKTPHSLPCIPPWKGGEKKW
ncbi:protein of unknown function [Nitrospina watsonii]|uniref:Uncharacterized protein n=1 Tax=Nitrospina watsonii TaxID=1323948 RepID=A0ABM9HAS9_9BACT|nr:protein of unknown function [Nitrospina watsonii]